MMIEASDQRKSNQNGGFHASQEYQAQGMKTTKNAISTLGHIEKEKAS